MAQRYCNIKIKVLKHVQFTIHNVSLFNPYTATFLTYFFTLVLWCLSIFVLKNS